LDIQVSARSQRRLASAGPTLRPAGARPSAGWIRLMEPVRHRAWLHSAPRSRSNDGSTRQKYYLPVSDAIVINVISPPIHFLFRAYPLVFDTWSVTRATGCQPTTCPLHLPNRIKAAIITAHRVAYLQLSSERVSHSVGHTFR